MNPRSKKVKHVSRVDAALTFSAEPHFKLNYVKLDNLHRFVTSCLLKLLITTKAEFNLREVLTLTHISS